VPGYAIPGVRLEEMETAETGVILGITEVTGGLDHVQLAGSVHLVVEGLYGGGLVDH
jgi:hypothetical protein